MILWFCDSIAIYKSVGCVLNYLLSINKDLKLGATHKARLTATNSCWAGLQLLSYVPLCSSRKCTITWAQSIEMHGQTNSFLVQFMCLSGNQSLKRGRGKEKKSIHALSKGWSHCPERWQQSLWPPAHVKSGWDLARRAGLISQPHSSNASHLAVRWPAQEVWWRTQSHPDWANSLSKEPTCWSDCEALVTPAVVPVGRIKSKGADCINYIWKLGKLLWSHMAKSSPSWKPQLLKQVWHW